MGNTTDRSQVLPFSVVMFDDEEGWEQYGVYATYKEADDVATKVGEQYTCQAGVADTIKFLDCTISPIMDITSIAVDK